MINNVYIVVRSTGDYDEEIDVFTDHDASRLWYDRLGGVERDDLIWREEPILDREFAEIAPLPGDEP